MGLFFREKVYLHFIWKRKGIASLESLDGTPKGLYKTEYRKRIVMAKRKAKKGEKKMNSKYKSYIKDPYTKKLYTNVVEEYTGIARIYNDK